MPFSFRLFRQHRCSIEPNMSCYHIRIYACPHRPDSELLTASTMSDQGRPQNWKALAPPIPNFTHQSSTLPRLPLPPLEATLQRLKDSLRPLARSTEEFTSVCRKIDDFGRSDGPGHILQQALLLRRSEKDNWLEEWWDDSWYLACRDSVSSRCSLPFFFLLHSSSRLPSMCHLTVSRSRTASPSLCSLISSCS